jgi:hypothetical protein
MPEARLILIAAPELIPALRERVGDDDEVLTFADSEPLRALEAISAQRPPVIALERLFAASPRGAALIARIKSDPGLDSTEIRILSHDSSYQRVSPRRRHLPPPKVHVRPPDRLDRGTRRAPRFEVNDDAVGSMDGQPVKLVDVSTIGVQLVTVDVVKAKQAVSVTLGAGDGEVTAAGTVVWARLELSRKGPTYRVGIELVDADAPRIGAFIEAHRVR